MALDDGAVLVVYVLPQLSTNLVTKESHGSNFLKLNGLP